MKSRAKRYGVFIPVLIYFKTALLIYFKARITADVVNEDDYDPDEDEEDEEIPEPVDVDGVDEGEAVTSLKLICLFLKRL